MKADSTNQVEVNAFLFAKIAKLERQIKGKIEQPTGDYLLPSEVLEILKISKNKFYSLVNQGYLKTIKLDPKGRKTYVLRSQVVALFPKNLPI